MNFPSALLRNVKQTRQYSNGLLLLTVLALLLPLFGVPATTLDAAALTIADRVACTAAIEEVYWQNRIWPDSNPASKPALSDVASEADLVALVDETLAQSLALEQQWQQPITGEMLQAELNRMAAASRSPAVLQELYAALDHDPALVAECLARPVLAERLLQERFAADERSADLDFGDWWAEARPDVDDFAAPAFNYTLPPITSPLGNDDSWQDTASIPLDDINGDVKGAAVWTGTEMVFMGDFDREAYRYNPATDSWQTASTLGVPLGLRDTTAVWTGTYVVASHGCTANNHNCNTSLAWRYDPLADLWESIPNAPISRTDQSAVWTGTEMIVWGGCNWLNDQCQVYPQTGARYNPDTNSWQTMSTATAPAGRTFPNLVWTGEEVIVWGGRSGNTNAGGRYDPDTDTWSSVSTSAAPIGSYSTAVWSGAEMLVWGGCTGSPFCNTPHDTGARYDPDTDTWTPLSTTNAPAARFGHGALWIGDTMLIWGGENGTTYLGSGSRYDPDTDSWTAVSSTNAPGGRTDHQMLWTGSLALVWGGEGAGNMRTGARYNPLNDSWTAVSTEDPDSFRTNHVAVWTGAEMIVWGGIGDGTANSGLNTGRRYDPATDSWSATTTAGAPPGAWDANAVWTGAEMIVWGGQSGTLVRDTGGRYNPMTDSWMTMAESEGRTDSAHAWTGTEMIVWGGSTWGIIWSNTGARYNPASNSWTPLTTAGAPSGRQLESGFVWSGTELLVWGGYGSTGEVGTGGRYNPATNSWTPISNVNAPQARNLHAAVWTGTEMIVWGGTPDYPQPLDTGARYSPATDTWTAMDTTNAPLPVARPEAIWSGAEMIVWGGECDEPGQPTCHTDSYEGGRYDPQTDTWTPTTLDGVPEARSFHTAVWTGEAMLVWGGIGTWSGYRHTGGLYYAEAPDNSAPLANDDEYQVQEGQTLNVDAPGVLANDSDPDGDPLSALLVASTINGSLILNGDGSFTYIPDPGFFGLDQFTYRAYDGLDTSNDAIVVIEVQEVPNSAPIAVDDSYSAVMDETLNVPAPGVLANDSDPDGDPLTTLLVSTTANGALTLNDDGSFSYTPDPGFLGTDEFTYRADDGQAASNVATVTIVVNEIPNNAPTASDDAYTTPQDETLTVAAPGLLANDSDPDGDPLSAALQTGPANGSVTVNADGSFTYTPNAGFSGADTFTYLVNDGRGGTDTATVTITVNPAGGFQMFLPVMQG